MNYSIILYVIGWVLNFEAAFMVPACVTGLIYREPETSALAVVALFCLAVGLLITKKKPRSMSLYAKEGFVTVALCWVVLSALGALPFVISRVIPSYVDALFEVVSGFTTTGSSILPEVEHMPHCLLFWRSFTHWIGGMGVLVFVMAVLPLAGGTNMYMMKAESPGPSVGKLVPRVKSTAVLLYGMYIGLSLLQLVFLNRRLRYPKRQYCQLFSVSAVDYYDFHDPVRREFQCVLSDFEETSETGSCLYGGARLLCYYSDGDSFDYRQHFRSVSEYLDCSAPCGFSGRFGNHDDRICHCRF